MIYLIEGIELKMVGRHIFISRFLFISPLLRSGISARLDALDAETKKEKGLAE